MAGVQHFHADDTPLIVVIEDDAVGNFLALEDRFRREAQIGRVGFRIIFELRRHFGFLAPRSRNAVTIRISSGVSTTATRSTRPSRSGTVLKRRSTSGWTGSGCVQSGSWTVRSTQLASNSRSRIAVSA